MPRTPQAEWQAESDPIKPCARDKSELDVSHPQTLAAAKPSVASANTKESKSYHQTSQRSCRDRISLASGSCTTA